MHGIVRSTTRLTPTMVRVVLGGPGLRAFAPLEATDAYVNVALPPDGAPYAAPFDVDEVRATLPRDLWPHRRRYTVRRWDPDRGELTLDVVVHDGGPGGTWASTTGPGDALELTGPAGGYRPAPDVDLHLLVGDESALPAIAASLEVLPSGSQAVVRLLCDGPDHELELATAAHADVAWLHRSGHDDADARLLPDAVERLALPGRVQAFVHGEAGEVREVRRHLLVDRRLDRDALSCSPYWRRHMDDEAWREVKAAWTAAVEREAS